MSTSRDPRRTRRTNAPARWLLVLASASLAVIFWIEAGDSTALGPVPEANAPDASSHLDRN